MSKHPTVGIVMDRLVTDENFRAGLIVEPVATLSDLGSQVEFTSDDVARFSQTNRLLRRILERLTLPCR
jgi:hypothetical protein